MVEMMGKAVPLSYDMKTPNIGPTFKLVLVE
jgi:hypothetical protein